MVDWSNGIRSSDSDRSGDIHRATMASKISRDQARQRGARPNRQQSGGRFIGELVRDADAFEYVRADA